RLIQEAPPKILDHIGRAPLRGEDLDGHKEPEDLAARPVDLPHGALPSAQLLDEPVSVADDVADLGHPTPPRRGAPMMPQGGLPSKPPRARLAPHRRLLAAVNWACRSIVEVVMRSALIVLFLAVQRCGPGGPPSTELSTPIDGCPDVPQAQEVRRMSSAE